MSAMLASTEGLLFGLKWKVLISNITHKHDLSEPKYDTKLILISLQAQSDQSEQFFSQTLL